FRGRSVNGYEIHMGRTEHVGSLDPFITKNDGMNDGAVSGRVAGTYFHGLFENSDFTKTFLATVARDRKLDWHPLAVHYSKDDEYNRLAATVGERLEMERIYGII